MNNHIQDEIKSLLYNFWIVKDENPELYYQLKKDQDVIRSFVTKNLGNNLIIHDRFIKLEKIPASLNKKVGIETFTAPLDYSILCIVLLFLEDKTRGDKFILSNLIEYIKNTAIALELDNIPDWNKISNRRSLINVMDFLKETYIIKVKDESKNNFTDDKNAEVLYESMGISNYLMRIFTSEINNYNKPKDFLNGEFGIQDDTKGDVRRYRVFRNLLYTPCLQMSTLAPSDTDYIKKNRIYIKNEIQNNIGMEVEVTQNLAFLYDESSVLEKDNFPNTKKITEIVLMVNTKILEEIENNNIHLDEKEIINVSEAYFEQLVKSIKEEKAPYLGKTYQDYTTEKFYREVITYMQKYNMIDKIENNIIIYPIISRMIGKTVNVEENKNQQLNLFGGDSNYE